MITAAGRRLIAALIAGNRRLAARLVITGAGRAFAQAALFVVVQRALTALFAESPPPLVAALGRGRALLVAGAALLAAQILAGAFTYANAVAQLRIAQAVELSLTDRVVRHLLGLSVSFFDRRSHGDLVQALRLDVTRVRLTVRAAGQVIVEAALLASLVAGAVSMSPRLAFLSLVIVPAASAPAFLLARRVIRSSYEARAASYALADVILQILRGVRVIKALRAERAEADRSLDLGRRYFDVLVKDLGARALGSAVLEILAGLTLVTILVAGGREVLQGRLAWPALLAFVMAVRAMYGPIHNLHARWLEIASMVASVDRVAELLAERPEVVTRPDAIPLPSAPRTIAFDRVTFSYGDGAVLRDVSFTVRAGETIGVVGPSGSGKSTLLSLIARFYDPTAGRVLLDGRDLRDLRLSDVYGHLAVVTQDTFLFSATVRENLRAARPGASDAEVESAARAAFIHEEILALPEGYDTRVGMNGRELSGGQRQRLAVARALIANAPILLLDEATSSLDSVAEAAVQRAIDGLAQGRTSVVVAHRLSTLRRADRVLVLDRGRVVGFAPHADLLRDCPVYRRLWEAQRLDEARAA